MVFCLLFITLAQFSIFSFIIHFTRLIELASGFLRRLDLNFRSFFRQDPPYFLMGTRLCPNAMLREAFQKQTGYFMTSCQRVGRWQTQNMISFPKEIMIRGLVLESLVRKSEPWMIHYFLKNTSPNPQLIHLHLYFCTSHQSIIVFVVNFIEFKVPIYPLFHWKWWEWSYWNCK